MLRDTFLFIFYTSLLLTLSTNRSLAEEKIELFRTNIKINADRKIDVTETMKIIVEGEKIRRGIIRALPKVIRSHDRPDRNVTYKVNKVTRNGVDIKYDLATRDNLLVINAYEPEVFLDHGEYTFIFDYTVTGYDFSTPESDVLDWHVTGYGWPLEIMQAEAFVTFPELVLPQNVYATAHAGTFDQPDFESAVTRARNKTVHFTSLVPLEDGAGLTISAAWPKGFFSGTELLSVPGTEKKTTENLLTIPDEDSENLLSIPDGNQIEKSVDSLDPKLFEPDYVENLTAEIRINSSGDVVVSETIVVYSEDIFQGIIRSFPSINGIAVPQLAFVDSRQISIEASTDGSSFYLISPDQLSPGNHTFNLQYNLSDAIVKQQEIDLFRFKLGDTDLALRQAELRALMYLPELMLPNRDLVKSSILSITGANVTDTVINVSDDNLTIVSEEEVNSGSLMSIEVTIPKGFIKWN